MANFLGQEVPKCRFRTAAGEASEWVEFAKRLATARSATLYHEGVPDSVKLYGINRLRETLVVAETTRRSMQSNRSTGTKPEVELRMALWHGGLRGYRKNVRKLPGTPDIVFTRGKLAVFVHGCFWHGHDCGKARIPRQNNAFWSEKIRLNQERHERNLEKLTALGFRAATVWECELKNDTEGVVRHLRGLLEGGG